MKFYYAVRLYNENGDFYRQPSTGNFPKIYTAFKDIKAFSSKTERDNYCNGYSSVPITRKELIKNAKLNKQDLKFV